MGAPLMENYNDIFPEDVGTEDGVIVWVIENFLPTKMEDVFYGKFYDGDCYIILRTEVRYCFVRMEILNHSP